MATVREKLIERAQKEAKRLQKLRRDPRYLRTMGKLKREKLVDVRDIPEYRGQVFLQDALWAAELEPRIFELLPTIVARRPKFFVFFELPPDLDRVVKEIQVRRPITPYQGIAAAKYARWEPLVSRNGKPVKVLRTFRLSTEDLETLDKLSKKKALSHTQILRLALEAYANSSL